MPSSIFKKGPLFLVFGIVALLPLIVGSPYYQQMVFMWILWTLVASASNLAIGYGGQLNAGIAAFYMVGAYTTTLSVLKLGLPWWVTIPAAGVASGITGLMVSIPCIKLGGGYLCIATLAFTYLMLWVGDNWGSVTGGSEGLHGVPHPDAIQLGNLVIIGFQSKTARLYWLLGIGALCLIVMYRVVKSRLGVAFLALRENEVLSQTVGINTVLAKITNFGISSFFLGIAGGCYAYIFHGVEPVSFSVVVTLFTFLIILIGGIGLFAGPVVGAGIYVILSEALRGTRGLCPIILGIILILILAFAPSGVVGMVEGTWLRMRGKRVGS